jgi:hypothetical protein
MLEIAEGYERLANVEDLSRVWRANCSRYWPVSIRSADP